MALNVIHKINSRIKFLYRKSDYLTYDLRRLLCNAIIQPHFDYVCSSWFLNLNKKLKLKLQASQNKCIKFCLHLENRHRVVYENFKKINWLPVEDRVHQCILSHIFKFFTKKCPAYVDELFSPVNNEYMCTRKSYLKLNQPFRKTNLGKNTISFYGPLIWNKLNDDIKQCESLNTFKHKVKDYFLLRLKNREDDIYHF